MPLFTTRVVCVLYWTGGRLYVLYVTGEKFAHSVLHLALLLFVCHVVQYVSKNITYNCIHWKILFALIAFHSFITVFVSIRVSVDESREKANERERERSPSS